jgi:hypothetical protein
MALKFSPPNQTAFLAALPLVMFLCCGICLAETPTQIVRFEGLLQGQPVTIQKRYRAEDIRVGNQSVMDLFKPIEWKPPSCWKPWAARGDMQISLQINSPDDLERLQQTFDAQPENQPRTLTLILRDNRNCFLRRIGLWGLGSDELYEATINVNVSTTCDEITRIVYEGIRAYIQDGIETARQTDIKQGETPAPIKLNEVYNKLLNNEIEKYMKTLNEAESYSPCLKTFRLMHWIEGSEVSGFGLGKYNLTEDLKKGLLEPAVKLMRDARSNWPQYNLWVKVVGYTDQREVIAPKELLQSETGIDHPLIVYYQRCIHNDTGRGGPTYIGFTERRGKLINSINNNCELGAVRAYVATAYLVVSFGPDDADYSYATGGVFKPPGTADANNGGTEKQKRGDPNMADEKKRKIDLEITFKAAKTDQ